MWVVGGDSLGLLVAAVATLTFCRISKRLPQYVMSWGMPLSSSSPTLLCTFLLLLLPHRAWPWYFYFIFFSVSIFGFGVFSVFWLQVINILLDAV